MHSAIRDKFADIHEAPKPKKRRLVGKSTQDRSAATLSDWTVSAEWTATLDTVNRLVTRSTAPQTPDTEHCGMLTQIEWHRLHTCAPGSSDRFCRLHKMR